MLFKTLYTAFLFAAVILCNTQKQLISKFMRSATNAQVKKKILLQKTIDSSNDSNNIFLPPYNSTPEQFVPGYRTFCSLVIHFTYLLYAVFIQ